MNKYYIQAISSNLIKVLNELAGNNRQVTEHQSVECLDRKGGTMTVPLWELPENVYLEIKSRATDYHFIDFGKVVEGVMPRNIREYLPVHRETVRFSRLKNVRRKKILKGTSVLRRPQTVSQKISTNQGVH